MITEEILNRAKEAYDKAVAVYESSVNPDRSCIRECLRYALETVLEDNNE